MNDETVEGFGHVTTSHDLRPEHMVEFYKFLGGGQRDAGFDGSLRPTARLAIVPGTTHYILFATTTTVAMAVLALRARRGSAQGA